jgi:hypothetical protein
MSAERCDMLAFVIALHDEANGVDIHPQARAVVETYFAQMFEDLNDVHRVVHLMNLVRHRLADEMRWHAEIEVADSPTSAVADLAWGAVTAGIPVEYRSLGDG